MNEDSYLSHDVEYRSVPPAWQVNINGMKMHRKIHPVKYRAWNIKEDFCKYPYQNYDTETSCYGSEEESSSAIWTNTDEEIETYGRDFSPKYSHPYGRSVDGDSYLDPKMYKLSSPRLSPSQANSSNWRSSFEGNSPLQMYLDKYRYTENLNKLDVNRNNIDDIKQNSMDSIIKAGGFNNTNLSEFLKDCDTIERCPLSRAVLSVDGDNVENYPSPLPHPLHIESSPERWFVLVIICLSIGIRSFVSVVFGQINDVFSSYFNVGAVAVDWLTNAGSLSTLASVIGMIICGGKRLRLRPLCLFMTGTASLGTTLLTAAMTDRDTGYSLAVAGQITMGFNNAVAMSISPLIAATWFPDGQVATALAAALIFVGVGEALGSYIPSMIVFTSGNSNFEDFGSGSSSADLESIMEITRFKLVLLFVIPTGMAICIFITVYFFINENPRFPPSLAQALIREEAIYKRDGDMKEDREHNISSMSRSSLAAATSWNGWSDASNLLRRKSFLIIVFVYGIVAASGSTSITLLSSMIRNVNNNDSEKFSSDALSGSIMTVLWLCFIAGPLVSGILLDRTRRYREIAVASIIGLSIGSIGIPLSLYCASYPGLFVSHTLLGFFMGASETAVFEIAAESTYPAPEITFASILNVSWMIFFVVFPVSGRFILNKISDNSIGPTVASSVPAILTVIAALLAICCLHPTYRRHTSPTITINENGSITHKEIRSKSNERTPLLHNL